MIRVLVAGSINMDVVVTAAGLPLTGETVPGKELNFFPYGKGLGGHLKSGHRDVIAMGHK